MNEQNGNMALWNSVHDTDAEFKREFTKTGGFSGTAIAPLYNVMRATKIWGPLGTKWGYHIERDAFVTGSPLVMMEITAEGSKPIVVGNEIIHVAFITLWYPGPNGEKCIIESVGQTTFVGKRKKKDKGGNVISVELETDEDAPKKSVTDALSKALSMLGFGADVRLGSFEDVKYVVEGAPTQPNEETAQPDNKEEKPLVSKEILEVFRLVLMATGRVEEKVAAHLQVNGLEEMTDELARHWLSKMVSNIPGASLKYLQDGTATVNLPKNPK